MAFIPVYIFILAITILIDYFAGLWIERTEGKRKKMILIASIISTCLVLFIFKYFNFFNTNFDLIARFFHWNYPISALQLILPIGLSFHTFQSLGYVIEVYRGKQKAERHFGIYALYVMFYPQLVAGPIERPQNMLHQFYETHLFDYERVTSGLKLMAWGMFKKVVIADRLAVFVNHAYNSPAESNGVSLLAGTILFAFQIFCDFSGYSDIAIGSAQVMGFKLMTNFNRPYFSKSISEFWKRWHISLSSWFRDYFYISLGGNRVPIPRWYFNLFLTFLVSGLWHGANWTYVFWGSINGLYLICGTVTHKICRKSVLLLQLNRMPGIYKSIKILFTFSLICFAWIFFRARSLNDAFYIAGAIFNVIIKLFINFKVIITDVDTLKSIWHHMLLGQPRNEFIIAILAILFMEGVHLLQRKGSIREMLSKKPTWFRWAAYYSLIIAILFFGAFSSTTQFIYFQF